MECGEVHLVVTRVYLFPVEEDGEEMIERGYVLAVVLAFHPEYFLMLGRTT